MSVFDKVKAWFGVTDKEVPAAVETNIVHPGGQAPPAPPSHEGRQELVDNPSSDTPPPRRHTTRQEDARIEREARSKIDQGDPAAAIELLSKQAILFCRHAPSDLPCLCKACLLPDQDRAEALGVKYVRDFVVSRHHALFYWMPEQLTDHPKQVRASVRAELRRVLRRPQPRMPSVITEPAREGVNPFTKQPMTFSPRPGYLNPFTRKPVP